MLFSKFHRTEAFLLIRRNQSDRIRCLTIDFTGNRFDDPVQLAKKNAAAARAVGIWPKTMTIRSS
ncbi:hypothetical protein RB298_03265 [Priestia sp. BR_2]